MDEQTAFTEFHDELEGFHKESLAAIQSFYAWADLREAFARDKACLDKANLAPALWQTILFSLQTTYFIALGRVFDEKRQTNHNIKTLLMAAERNKGIFSKAALTKRKQTEGGLAGVELMRYVQKAAELTNGDIAALNVHAQAYRASYRGADNLRNKIYAHKEKITAEDRKSLLSDAKLIEIENILTFLVQLHDYFWQRLYNGRVIEISPYTVVVPQIIDVLQPKQSKVQKILLGEIGAFFKTSCFEQ